MQIKNSSFEVASGSYIPFRALRQTKRAVEYRGPAGEAQEIVVKTILAQSRGSKHQVLPHELEC